MESGTVLHLALLRKTSQAKKRKRLNTSHPKDNNSNNKIFKADDDQNFILEGWGQSQDSNNKNKIKSQSSARIEGACLFTANQSRDIHSHRDEVRNSKTSGKRRNKIYSQRKCDIFKPISNYATKPPNQFVLNLSMSGEKKSPNLKICFQNKVGRTNSFKQNHILIQNLRLNESARKASHDLGKQQIMHQSFTQFVHSHGMRVRKYFKN